MQSLPFNWSAWPSWSVEEISQAYQKASISLEVPWAPITAAVCISGRQRQRLRRKGGLILYATEEDTSGEITNSERIAPTEAPTPLPSNRQDLIAALEGALTRQALEEQHGEVLTCEAHRPFQREAIGLPPYSLATNERLLATHKHIKGIHYADVTLNGPQSFRCIRKEVANLQVVRVLWCGSPTVWLVIPPRHSDKLESRVTECLKIRPACSQFVRHERLIIPPATLEKWGISFSIFAQYPGEVVKIDYLAYSYTWHTGADKSETVNCSESEWTCPPMYKFCRKSTKCRTESHVTADALTIGLSRPLQFIEDNNNDEEDLTDAASSIETEPQQNDPMQPPLGRPLPYLFAETQFGHSPRVAPQDREEESPSPYLCDFPSPSDTTTDQPTPKSFDGDEASQFSVEGLFIRPTDAPEDPPSDHQGHSPGSEFYISTSHVSHRRLPGQEARRVVGTPLLNSPTNAGTPDDNKTQSNASEDDELWSNMSESGLPTGMNSLTMYEDDSPALIMPKSPGHSTTMASEKAPLSTATPKDSGRLQGYLLTPPHSDSATGPREAVREIEHLVDFGIKQFQHFTWYSPRQTTDERALAVETAKALSSLRPRQWLNDDAVMETLHRLADNRSNVQVVDSHTFQSYYERWTSKKELPSKAFQWESPSLVLIPVFEAAHWFLVSMKFGEGIITIHDDLQHSEIENFMLNIFPDSWSIDRRGGLGNDGSSCGVILLQEAERLLNPDLITTPDFNLLRRRYLEVLLRDLPLQIRQQGLHRGVDQDSLSEGTSPSTQSTASTLRKGRATHSPSEDLRLEELASTVGCVAVLRNLQKMVKSLRESPGQADSSIKGAVNTFTRGKSKEALGSLEQDYSSLRVARRFRELVVDCRTEAAALRKKRKRGQPYSEGKRGVGADSQAYDRLLDECGEDATLLRDDLKKANDHGRRLLEYENISGLEHPIWMLFPAENTKCPTDESLLVKPIMYRQLDDGSKRLLVDLVRSKNQRLWACLSRLNSEFARLMQGGDADLHFLQDLEYKTQAKPSDRVSGFGGQA